MKPEKRRGRGRGGFLLACFESPAVAGNAEEREEGLGSPPVSPATPSPSPSSSSRSSFSAASKQRRRSWRLLAVVVRSAVLVSSLVELPALPSDEDDPNSDGASFSSSFSSFSSTATEESEPTQPSEGKNSGGAADIGFWLLMLVVLFVVIFWGRACAIMWTSTCLCFMFGGRSHRRFSGGGGCRRQKPAGGMRENQQRGERFRQSPRKP
ncbi:unnamed protein product [Spirodela intermedia]|uniref:Uncharacterized protein n=1 Tax=Spirodela intermedia TaxID=51605 RepID=A0A7I8IN62_SPIIN|nr:unnamed protein product [Spirodela intermedia]CAA6658395.1 unnamed protein product [Spirodela intermedia]